MTREIKFRGKCLDNDEWVSGFYAPTYLYERNGKVSNEYSIIKDDTIGTTEMMGCGVYSGLPARYAVNTETVGQYTGLKDKNGVEIYEGDIVNISDFNSGHKIGKVVYNDGACCYRIWGDLFDYGLGIYQDDNIEVIGNIYDNPELLEGEKC